MNGRKTSDSEDTILRFLQGDEEAFTLLVRQWEGRVYNLALRMLGNREDAQDVAQDTFFSVYKAAGGLRDPSSFNTWLYRIALNHCRARWRSRSPELSLDDSQSESELRDGSGSLGPPVLRGTKDPVELRDLIRKALLRLSQDQRTAVVLKEYLGLSLEEVAQVTDVPLSTAKSRLYHGLREVQRNLVRLGVRP